MQAYLIPILLALILAVAGCSTASTLRSAEQSYPIDTLQPEFTAKTPAHIPLFLVGAENSVEHYQMSLEQKKVRRKRQAVKRSFSLEDMLIYDKEKQEPSPRYPLRLESLTFAAGGSTLVLQFLRHKQGQAFFWGQRLGIAHKLWQVSPLIRKAALIPTDCQQKRLGTVHYRTPFIQSFPQHTSLVIIADIYDFCNLPGHTRQTQTEKTAAPQGSTRQQRKGYSHETRIQRRPVYLGRWMLREALPAATLRLRYPIVPIQQAFLRGEQRLLAALQAHYRLPSDPL